MTTKRRGFDGFGNFVAVSDHAHYVSKVEAAYESAAQNLTTDVEELGRRLADKAQGNFAESWHAETFNADAVVHRMDEVKASVLKSNDYKSVDIRITDEGQIASDISSKSFGSASQSVREQIGYGDQERLIPHDHLSDGQKFLSERIQVGENPGYNEIDGKLTDRIRYGDAESQPLTRAEAEQKLESVRRGETMELQPQIDASVMMKEAAYSGSIAAGITFGMTVAPQLYNSFVEGVRTGRVDKEKLAEAFRTGGKKGGEAFLRGSIASTVSLAAQSGALGAIMQGADPTMIGAITYMAFEGVNDFRRYRSGELNGELFADSMLRKSVSTTGGMAGATIGQAVIPVPILGAMVGAALGSIVANAGYTFTETVTEAYFRSEQFEHLKRLNIELARNWCVFASSHELWLQHGRMYDQVMARLLQESSRTEAEIDATDAHLMKRFGLDKP